MRDGADHLITIPYDDKYCDTCPIRAVEQWIAVGYFVGWDMKKGYFPPSMSTNRNSGESVRGSLHLSASQMAMLLEQNAVAAGLRADFSMHSFRSGGAVSRALAGDDLSTIIMQRAFWKNTKKS